VRSRSLTRDCELLSGDDGGVPGVPGMLVAGLRGARLGTVWFLDFLDFVKIEGRTMEARARVAACVTEFGSLQQLLVEGRHQTKSYAA
jgi:hypothetical protein